MTLPITHEQAEELLGQHIKSESLLGHSRSVEYGMRYFAKLYGEDVEYWGMVGLLHDLDYEKYPDEHCNHTPEYLREAGFDDGFIHAVLSHGYKKCTDVAPESMMEKVIFTIDELCGFINACALMRPSKSTMDMEVSSVKKKFKTLNFAAAVDREHIKYGAELMGIDMNELFSHTIMAMREYETAMKGETV